MFRFGADDGEEKDTPPMPLPPPAPPWTGREGEEEEEGELSDLDPDIEQYIASEQEVCTIERERERERDLSKLTTLEIRKVQYTMLWRTYFHSMSRCI